MTNPGFITTAQADRARAAVEERLVERLKRAIDDYISDNGYRPRTPIANYCKQIGLGIRITPGAGAEYDTPDTRTLAHKIDQTSMPSVLRRYYE